MLGNISYIRKIKGGSLIPDGRHVGFTWSFNYGDLKSFFFAIFRPNLRGGNSYHSSFDDPLRKGAAHEADVTTC